MGGLDTGWRLAALGLGWIAGVALQLSQAELWPSAHYALLIGLGVLGLLAARRWRPAFAAAAIGVVLLGFAVTGWQAAQRMAAVLPTSLEGRDIVATGVVASLPQAGPGGVRFRFDVEEAHVAGQPVEVPARLALGWYAGFREDPARAARRMELRAGQRWRFTVRLRQPHGNLNPHGFDYELFLLEQGVRATGTVREAALLHPAAGYPVERLRQRVRDAIEAHVADRRAAGVLAALAVGDQGAIEQDNWDLFRNTGVSHLVAISGLHVTMFAWLAGVGVAALWRRSARAMLWLGVPHAARWGGFIAAWLYALLAGWGVPSQRTVWMLATVTVLRTLGVRWPWLLVLLLAAVVVTAFDPWALLQPGFWLSFMAVGLLMASAPGSPHASEQQRAPLAGWRGWPARMVARLRQDVRTQVVATVGLTPLTLIFFQQVSVVGFVANLLAIPLVTLVITPLALLGIVAAPLWSLGAVFVRLLEGYLTWLAALPGAVWIVPAAPLWAQIAGLVAAVLLVAPLPWRARLLALPLALPLVLPPLDLPGEGRFELLALDVGQGTSVLLRTRAHLLIYDTGPQYSAESDAGQRVLLPLLRARGETRIDRLVLSHRDLDHVGGARALLTALPVDDLMSSLEPEHPLLALAPQRTRCEAGQAWSWDGVRFDVLHPLPEDYAAARKSNAMSCVVRVSDADGASVLLSGDIERAQEAALVARHGDALQSDVLIAPHHGSRTSSTAAFLDAVAPHTAVFQAAYRSRFGHPAPDVLQRYRERGIAIVASASCGAWWQRADASHGTCRRDAARRYWHHRSDRER